MTTKFEDMRSPEIGELAAKGGMVVLPIGACEEHGRHLPVKTDTELAYRAALDAASRVQDDIPIAVLPPVWFGYTVAVLKKWPGTVTIRPKVLIDLLYDICKSLIDMGIVKILIVNGHGNNPGVLDVVARTVGDDFDVFPGIVNTFALWNADLVRSERKSAPGGIGHAGEGETALMLHLTPELVNMDVADATDAMKSDLKSCPVDAYPDRKKTLYLSTWYLEDSTYGGAGDPSEATPEFGAKLHAATVDTLTDIIREFFDTQTRLAARRPRSGGAR